MYENNRHNSGLIHQDPEDFSKYCRDVVDFPRKGIVFKDITTLLKNGDIFKRAIDEIGWHFNLRTVDTIACIDARGFIIGAALAYRLGCGLVPVRKKGKLPWLVNQKTYDLEYGVDTLEIHRDAIEPGQRVLVVDDVLATGGTSQAVVSLIKEMQGVVLGAAFLLELKALNGRERLKDVYIYSLIKS